MIKFLGLLSKKKKISIEKTAKLLVTTLDEVIVNGFVEIQDFINDNNNLERNPNLTDKDIRWFRLIVFVGNLKILPDFFDEDQAEKLHNQLLDFMAERITGENEIALEQLSDYCTYLDELLRKSDNCIAAMATALFDKYNINKSLVLNSDVIWSDSDKELIVDMINSYPEEAEAFLGLVPKSNFRAFKEKGDFCKLKNNDLIRYDASSEPYVYIGAQIISKNAFNGIEKDVFSVNEAWNSCINKKTLKGYQFNTNARLTCGNASLDQKRAFMGKCQPI